MPKTCPTLTHPEITKDSTPYLADEEASVMRAADATPFDEEGNKRNRVDELIHFAKSQHMIRLGVAFCVSMTKEAQQFGKLLEQQGLEAELVCCRVGAIDYNEIGLTKKNPDKFASICNPVAQAKLLNEKHVDLVVQMGLCIGHDLLLQRNANAPVTTLVVKDRALDHHPIAALR